MAVDLSGAFFKISNQICTGRLSIDECLKTVRSNSGLVNDPYGQKSQVH